MSQRIKIDGNIHQAEWLTSTRAGQAVLASTYEVPARPRCMCVPAGVEMYVGRRRATYYLSRLPGTGVLHADSCDSMEQGQNLVSGIDAYAPGVLREDVTGTMTLNASAVGGASIDGLLDLLIEQAGINVHSPSSGRRSWADVARMMRLSASLVASNDGLIAPRLLVPDAYDMDRHAEQETAAESFLKTAEPRLVCAPLKSVKASQYGWLLHIKHLPNLRFWLSGKVAERAVHRNRGTLSFEDPPALALCLLAVKPSGTGFTVTDCAIRRTDVRFMPCTNEDESLAANELDQRRLSFMRPLRFDAPSQRVLADYFLLDAENNCDTPVFVIASSGDAALDEVKNAHARMLARCGRAAVFERSGWIGTPLPGEQPAVRANTNSRNAPRQNVFQNPTFPL